MVLHAIKVDERIAVVRTVHLSTTTYVLLMLLHILSTDALPASSWTRYQRARAVELEMYTLKHVKANACATPTIAADPPFGTLATSMNVGLAHLHITLSAIRTVDQALVAFQGDVTFDRLEPHHGTAPFWTRYLTFGTRVVDMVVHGATHDKTSTSKRAEHGRVGA